MSYTINEFWVFNQEGITFGEIQCDPMAGYGLLAQAINYDPQQQWFLRFRRVEINMNEKIDDDTIVVNKKMTKWTDFYLTPKNK